MFPRFLERWLGIRPPGPGEGLEWELTHRFPWPAWLTALAVVGLIAFVVAIYRRDAERLSRARRWLLVTLRLTSLGLLLFFLTELALSIERTGLPTLLLLVDTSASMRTPDAIAQGQSAPSTRIAAATELLSRDDGAFLRELLERYKLRVHAMAAADRPLGGGEIIRDTDLKPVLAEIQSLEADGEQSRLGDALRRILGQMRGTPPSAVILLTDGIVTDGERLSTAARLARQKSVPVLSVAVGRSEPMEDVDLVDALVDDVAFVGDPVTINCRIGAEGLRGRSGNLRVRRSDQEELLASTEVTLPDSGKTTRSDLVFTPTETGEFEFVIDVAPVDGEKNTTNNVRKRRISVRKDKIRVLLVDREPRWEYRELKALLEREKTVDLKVLLQEADPEYATEDRVALARMPARREEVFLHDVIVLGDVDPAFLNGTAIENLRDFVGSNGGGLVLVAGPKFNPGSWRDSLLDPLFPVDLSTTLPVSTGDIAEPYALELTGEGSRGVPFFRFAEGDLASRQAWNKLPGWYGLVESPDLKRGAQALVTHPLRTGSRGKLPVIAMQRYGAGKVVYHASDETWRWRFRTGDLYFGRYWVQMIRYLARSKLLGRDRSAEVLTDRQSYRAGEPVTLRVRFLDERQIPEEGQPLTLTVEQRGGEGRRLLKLDRATDATGVFESQLPGLPEGLWRAWLSEPLLGANPPEIEFRVESPARESRVLQTDLPELNAVAEATGGRVYTLETARRLPRDLPRGNPVLLENKEPFPLWNHWLGLVLLAGTLSAEWILRKVWQLV
jgi:hypothetical protein